MKKTKYKKGDSSYKEEFDQIAYIACKEGGLTDIKIADLFSVSKQTIYNWRRNNPTFKEHMARGKDEFNSSVAEVNLMKRVKGYAYTEITRKPVKTDVVDDKGKKTGTEMKMTVVKRVRKFIPPSVKAIKYFLRNRDKIRWPDKIDIEFNGLTVLLKKKRFDGESVDND